MKPHTAYIVLNRIYDVIETAGLGAKNALDKYDVRTAFVNESGVFFAVDKHSVKSRITVGDLTLAPSKDNNNNIKWEHDAQPIGQVFSCTDKAHNDTLKAFLATLTGQNIPRDKLLVISEIAAALVVEYSGFQEYYAIRSIKDRNEKIAALQTRADDAEKFASDARAIADDADRRLAAAEKRAAAAEKRAETRAEVADKFMKELEDHFAAASKRAVEADTRADLAEKRAIAAERRADYADECVKELENRLATAEARAESAEKRAVVLENLIDVYKTPGVEYHQQVAAHNARMAALEGKAMASWTPGAHNAATH